MKVIGVLKMIERRVIPNIGVAFFTLAVTWMLIEASSRQLFHRSFEISEEVVMFSLAWAIFLTLAQSGRENFHIDVDLVFRVLPAGVKRVVRSITLLLSAFYSLLVVFSAVKFIPHLYANRIISSSSMELPLWAVYLAIPIGGLLLALYYLETFFSRLSTKRTKSGKILHASLSANLENGDTK